MFEFFHYMFGERDYNLPARADENGLSNIEKEARNEWNFHFANFNPARNGLHSTLQSFKAYLDEVVLQEGVEHSEANKAAVVGAIDEIKNALQNIKARQAYTKSIMNDYRESDYDFLNILEQKLCKPFKDSRLSKLEVFLKKQFDTELDSISNALDQGTMTSANAIIKAKQLISSMQYLAKLQRALDAIFVRNELKRPATVHNTAEVKKYNLELGRQMLAELENCKVYGEDNVFPAVGAGDGQPQQNNPQQNNIVRIANNLFYSMVCESFGLAESTTSEQYYKDYVMQILFNKMERICKSGAKDAKFYDFHAKQIYENLNYEKCIMLLKFKSFSYYIDCSKTFTSYAMDCSKTFASYATNKYTLATVGGIFLLALGGTFLYPKFDGNIDAAFLAGFNIITQELSNCMGYLASKMPSVPSVSISMPTLESITRLLPSMPSLSLGS